MILQLGWKEYREARGIWLAIALMATFIAFAAPPLVDALQVADPASMKSSLIGVTVAILGIAYGLVAGAQLLAGERETRTLDFLDHLAPRRWSLWESKVRVGAVLAVAQGVFLMVLFAVAGPDYPGGAWAVPLLPLLALEGFIWGCLGSALCPTVFLAAIAGAGFGALSWILTGTIGAAALSGTVVVLLRIVLDAGMLALSAHFFCKPDQLRLNATLRGTRAAAAPSSVTVLMWLAWRQVRTEVLVLAGAALLLGSLLGEKFLFLWPFLTLALGVLCGTAVWSHEQTAGTRRFLADQSLSPTRVWVIKTLSGVEATLVLIALLFLGAELRAAASQVSQPGRESSMIAVVATHLLDFPRLLWVHLLMWGMHGVAVGVLLGQLCSKRIVAVVGAFGLAGGLSVLWLPSLVSYGLPWWQVFVAPLLLLLASRLVFEAWSADRLGQRRPILAMTVCGLLVAGCSAGSLWSRVLEIPDVGEPFDVEAFEATLPPPQKNEAARIISSALRGLVARSKEVGDPLPKADRAEAWEHIGRVEREGWGAAPPELGPWLDQLFASDWYLDLRRGVGLPLGMLRDPRGLRSDTLFFEANESHRTSTFCVLRAHQLQARGQDEAALEHLTTLLALSRHLRHKSSTLTFYSAWGVEHSVEGALLLWGASCARPPLIRKALQELEQHEKTSPSVTDALKSDFLSADEQYRHWLERSASDDQRETAPGQAINQIRLLGLQLPWERERARRLLNYSYAVASGGAPANVRIEQLIGRSPLGPFSALSHSRREKRAVQALCRIRALRLQLALSLFERENQRPARELDELRPPVLSEVPRDPYTGNTFGYRVSPGEQISLWEESRGREMRLDVGEGQGIVWSAGPDGEDERERRMQRSDLVFLVPRVR